MIKDKIARTERPGELYTLVKLSIKIDNRLYKRQIKKERRNPMVIERPR
jgi:hypothetical protein